MRRTNWVAWFAGAALLMAAGRSEAPAPARARCAYPAGHYYSNCDRLFLIAVGVDSYPAPLGGLTQSEADVRRIAGRLACEWKRPWSAELARDCTDFPISPGRDSSARIDLRLLTGAGATRENISQAFATVQKELRPGDTFVFYFAGRSVPIGDSTSQRTVLLPSDVRIRGSLQPDPKGRTPRGSFDNAIELGQLKQWLDNIQAGQQFLILDAGDTEEFGGEFQRVLNETNPVAAALTPRNRVLLFNRGVGLETPAGGLLTYLLTRSRIPILEVFESKGVARLSFELVRRQLSDSLIGQSLREDRANFPLFELISERDFLRQLQVIIDTAGVDRGSLGPRRPAPPAGGAQTGRNFALLIGTNNYDAAEGWRDLKNPIPDVSALDEELRTRFGFETRVLMDPTKDSVLNAILAIKRAQFDSLDQVLIFIAGHGHYDEEQDLGFVVLRDGKPRRVDPFGQTYLPHNQLSSFTNNLSAKHVLVMLDVCFGGTFAGEGGARSEEEDYRDINPVQLLLRKAKYKTRQYITSGGKEYVPDGRPGRHSPFAARLLEALREVRPGEALTLNRLRNRLETVIPEPRAGGFGDNELGSDFVLIARH